MKTVQPRTNTDMFSGFRRVRCGARPNQEIRVIRGQTVFAPFAISEASSCSFVVQKKMKSKKIKQI
jgi:hypothetical protein